MLDGIYQGSLLPILALWAVACGGSGSDGKQAGESCTETAECQSGLTCVWLVCAADATLDGGPPGDADGSGDSDVTGDADGVGDADSMGDADMTLDGETTGDADASSDADSAPGGDTIEPGCSPNCATPEGAKWLPILGGKFQMGCSPNDDACEANEKPAHSVTISAFQMLETEVTEAQYVAVMNENPSCNFGMGGGADNPVECVDWPFAKAFCEAIGGRLPTEAEWEYAARGGTETKYYCGDDPACLDDIAWHGGTFPPGKHPVKQKEPNAYELYDMLGNVGEWTNDWYAEAYYESSPSSNPPGPDDGTARVSRGVGFLTDADGIYHRVSFRDPGHPMSAGYSNGFRCARSQ